MITVTRPHYKFTEKFILTLGGLSYYYMIRRRMADGRIIARWMHTIIFIAKPHKRIRFKIIWQISRGGGGDY